jgi:hypothetical protein
MLLHSLLDEVYNGDAGLRKFQLVVSSIPGQVCYAIAPARQNRVLSALNLGGFATVTGSSTGIMAPSSP